MKKFWLWLCVVCLGITILSGVWHPTLQTAAAAKATTPKPRASANSTPTVASLATSAVSATNPAPPATTAAPPLVTGNKRLWDPGFLQSLYNSSSNSPVRFELVGGRFASGTIRTIERVDGRVTYVAGDLNSPERGRFFFQRQTMPGKAGDFVGVVEFLASKTGYRIEPSGANGAPELVELPLEKIICLALPPPDPALTEPEPIPPLDPSDFPDYPIPDYQEGIIPLQSLAGAVGVLYIDYRGGYTPTWGGITYDRPNVSNGQIKDVWKRVAEDYIPFNINVTTDLKVYQNAPQNSRQRCVVTPTTTAAPGAGGVAYMNSWKWTGDTPCWVFMTSGKACAEAVSHEVGHTLSLGHDGQNPSTGYYGGQGSGEVGWAPIMGVSYYKNVSQWSKGEYTNANNIEDDLAKIVGNNDNVDYRTDDTGPVLATSRYVEIYSNNLAFAEGVIETTGDTDAFQFTTSGGAVSMRANAVGDWGNLAIQATLYNASDVLIASNNPQSTLWAAISTTVPAGTYTFRVTGVGRNDPLTTGFSAYASLGYYTVTGTVANARLPDRFTIPENTPNGSLVGYIAAKNASGNPLVYKIVSGNTSNAFALNNSGALTVSSSSVLNYEALGKNSQLPVQFELLVNITNTVNSSLTELNRRVVVAITDINEAPSVTGFSASALEHTQPGTLIGTVKGSDPDFYNLLSYAIVSGDTNRLFTIDDQAGEIRVAGDLNRSVQTSYQLKVRVSDNVGPNPLMATSTVSVTVLPNNTPFNPGGINYAIYSGISGNLISNLTNAASFPLNPASEKVISSFEGDTDRGDNYGSVVRGIVIPPGTGSYTFWIATDDNGELWMSTSTDPAAMARIAYISGDGSYAAPREWNKFSTQKSAARTLYAGQGYYIEARQKEGSGGDNFAVGWAGPGISGTNVISGIYLAPYPFNYVPRATGFTGKVRRDAFAGKRVGRMTVTDMNTADTDSFSIVGGNSEGIFAVDQDGWVQVADPAALQATTAQSYTLSIRVTDSGSPPLSATATATITIAETNAILVTTVQREMFLNIGNGTAVGNLTGNAKYPGRPDELDPMTGFSSQINVADNYGSRVRGFVIPPLSGSYRFFIASDDASQLKLSTSENPALASQIAYVSGYTGTNEWTKEANQTSAVQTLVGGQRYYIEALQKEGGGGDHVVVAWTGPFSATTNVIDGAYLDPCDINAAPQFTAQTLGVFATAANGTFIGNVSALDSPMDTLTFRIVDGNTNNTFALDPATGAISLADNTLITNSSVASFTLVLEVQDSGYGGLYPYRTSRANVTIGVLPENTPFVWTGADSANSWALAGNWRGAAPANGARVIFGFAARQTNVNDTVSSLTSVQFTNSGFYITGSPVALQAGITNTGDNTWALNTALSAAQTWGNSSGTLTLGGNVTNSGFALNLVANGDIKVSATFSGSGGLTKSGTGRLLISGKHGHTGTTIVSAASGTTSAVEVNGPEDLDMGDSDLTMNGRMDLWNHNASIGALSGGGMIYANDSTRALIVGANNHSGSFTGILTNRSWSGSSALALVKTGTGTQTLTGNSSYSGGTVIRSGQVSFSNGSALGVGPVTLVDAGTSSNSVALMATAAVTLNNPVSVSSIGTGIVTIGTANISPGAVNTQFGGSLALGRDVVLQAGSTDRTTFAGQITGPGGVTIASPFASARRVVFDRPSGPTNTFGGDILIGTNAWLQLGVANNLGNRTVPDSASVSFSPGAALRVSAAASGDTEIVGGLNSLTAAAGTIDLVSGTTFTFGFGGNGESGVFSGNIANSVGLLSLQKSGAGTQVLSGVNTFGGSCTVSGGKLVVASSAAMGAVTAGTLVNGGAALVLSNDVTIPAEPLILNGFGVAGGGALLQQAGNCAFNGPITLGTASSIRVEGGTLTLGGTWNTLGNTVTFDSATGASVVVSNGLTGTGGLTKIGAGTALLYGPQSFTGLTLINQGTLALGPAAALISPDITLPAGAVLDVSAVTGWSLGAGQTLRGCGTISGSATLNGTLLPGPAFGILTITGDTLLAGNTILEISRSSAVVTNDALFCSGVLTPGGALVVTNVGPDALSPGDRFVLLKSSAFGEASFASITLPPLPLGLAWDASSLLIDGTLKVLGEPVERPSLSITSSNGALAISWPTNYLSYVLDCQTNAPGQGIGSTWYQLSTANGNLLIVLPDATNGSVFYRLRREP